MSLEGVGGVVSKRLRELLERFHREEIFAFISVDRENGGKHLRDIQNYANDNLLPAGFNVWAPDFESANFALTELAMIASRFATSRGYDVEISVQDIEQEMQQANRPAGKAIGKLFNASKFYAGKGKDWGEQLAIWALEHPCPDELADERGNRPIIGTFSMIVGGQSSHYQATVGRFRVDSHGRLVERR